MADEFDGINDERLEQTMATTEGLFDAISDVSLPGGSAQDKPDAGQGKIDREQTVTRIWNQTDILDHDSDPTTSVPTEDAYIWNQEVEAGIPTTDADRDEAEPETPFNWVDPESITDTASTPDAETTDDTPPPSHPDTAAPVNSLDAGPEDAEPGDRVQTDREDPVDHSSAGTEIDAPSKAGSSMTAAASGRDVDDDIAAWDIATGRFQRVDDVEPASNRESHTDVATTADDTRLWNSWDSDTDASVETLIEDHSTGVEPTSSEPADDASLPTAAAPAETPTETANSPAATPESTPHADDNASEPPPATGPETSADPELSVTDLDTLLTPQGAQVLVEGSMDAPATHAACDRLLDPDHPHHTFIIAPEDRAAERVQQVHTSEEGETTVVALMTQSPTATAQSRTIRTDAADPVTIERVNAYTDFSRIGILISQALAELDDSLPTVACFHGVETLVQSVDAEPLFRFLHIITNELSMANVTTHYHIDRDQHPQMTGTIEPLFEQSVTVAADGYDIETQSESSRD